MRSICFAPRVTRSRHDARRMVGCALTLLSCACAQGGIDDAELSAPATTIKGKSDGGHSAHDARVAGGDTADTVASGRDAGMHTGSSLSSSTTTAGKDGGDSSASAIKCPSPMTCSAALATILSVVDSTVKDGQSLCAESGGLVPMAVSCKSVDECKSARLTASSCSGGYCIQPCTP